MLLTLHHHYHPFTHSPSSTTPFRPLHLNTSFLNLKLQSTPHNFTTFTVNADSLHRRSQISLSNHVAGDTKFDSFLSFLELSSILSSLVVSASVAVIAVWKKDLFVAIGNRVASLSLLLVVVGVLSGALIRRRKLRDMVNGVVPVSDVNLLQRIEKLEEELRSSGTVVRVLSRQLEKLGIRFRLTRKSLKEPITETAVLAQKNSEAARALAMQSDILEKELVEIQKVLLAMQEQQRKQLDLILAIGKASKLWENKREEHGTVEMSNSSVNEVKKLLSQFNLRGENLAELSLGMYSLLFVFVHVL